PWAARSAARSFAACSAASSAEPAAASFRGRYGAARRLDDRSARGLGCTPNRQRATEGGMIIDIHGHYTTAPKELEAYRQKQIADLKEPSQARAKGTLSISDDQIRESIEKAQLKLQRERGTDVTIFSPRAAGMGHHIGDATTSLHWSQECNDLIHRGCTLFPKSFVGVCQLPQTPGVPPA